MSAPGSDDATGYDASYYEANGQADDRPALRFYTRLVRRYTDGGPYLDFGCGTGHLLRHLSGLGPASGFEISEYSARTARQNAPGCVVVTDPDDLPTGEFGALTSVHVLEHLPDAVAEETLATWRRVLRPGGYALAVMPDPAGRGRALSGDAWLGYDDPTHVNLKPHAEWRTFLTDRGFQLVREGTDGLWNVPYSRLPKLLDAGVHAVPAFVQFLAGRMMLRPGAGESCLFLLRRAPD